MFIGAKKRSGRQLDAAAARHIARLDRYFALEKFYSITFPLGDAMRAPGTGPLAEGSPSLTDDKSVHIAVDCRFFAVHDRSKCRLFFQRQQETRSRGRIAQEVSSGRGPSRQAQILPIGNSFRPVPPRGLTELSWGISTVKRY